jgi:hypothetical protein
MGGVAETHCKSCMSFSFYDFLGQLVRIETVILFSPANYAAKRRLKASLSNRALSVRIDNDTIHQQQYQQS